MKQHAAMMTKTLKDIDRASQDVKTIESDLATTGSTKTADDVQIELDSISNELSVLPTPIIAPEPDLTMSRPAGSTRGRKRMLCVRGIAKAKSRGRMSWSFTRWSSARATCAARSASGNTWKNGSKLTGKTSLLPAVNPK